MKGPDQQPDNEIMGAKLAEAFSRTLNYTPEQIQQILDDEQIEITEENRRRLKDFSAMMKDRVIFMPNEVMELGMIMKGPSINHNVQMEKVINIVASAGKKQKEGLLTELEEDDKLTTTLKKMKGKVQVQSERPEATEGKQTTADTYVPVRSGIIERLLDKGFTESEAEEMVLKSLDKEVAEGSNEEIERITANLLHPDNVPLSVKEQKKENIPQMAASVPDDTPSQSGGSDGTYPPNPIHAETVKKERKYTQEQQIDNFFNLTKTARKNLNLSHKEAFGSVEGYQDSRNAIRKIKGRLKKLGTEKETPETKAEIQELRDELATQIRVFRTAARAHNKETSDQTPEPKEPLPQYTDPQILSELKNSIETATDLNEKINATMALAQADTRDLHITFDSYETTNERVKEQIGLAKQRVSEKLRALINTLGSESVNEQTALESQRDWESFVAHTEQLVAQQNDAEAENKDSNIEFSAELRKHLDIPSIDVLATEKIIQSHKTSENPVGDDLYNEATDVMQRRYTEAQNLLQVNEAVTANIKSARLARLENARNKMINELSSKNPLLEKDLSVALSVFENSLTTLVEGEEISPERALYETKRKEWMEAKQTLEKLSAEYFGEENLAKQKQVAQELYDKSKTLSIPYLGILFNRKRRNELKLEQNENEKMYSLYTQAQKNYAAALKEALSMRTAYREENKHGFDVIKAQLGARFFAKEGDEGFRAERSYLVNELVFNKEILPARKKNLFTKTVGIYQKMPYKTRMLIGGAFAGTVGAATGGLATAPSALMRFAFGATLGAATARYVSGTIMKVGEPAIKRQTELVRKTRKGSIDAFDPDTFFISKELIAKTEKKLERREAITKGAATTAGLGAAYIMGQGISEGIAGYQAGITNNPTQTGIPSWEQTGRGLPPNVVEMPSLKGGSPEFTLRQDGVGTLTPDSDILNQNKAPFTESTNPNLLKGDGGIESNRNLDTQLESAPNNFEKPSLGYPSGADTTIGIETVVPKGSHAFVLEGVPSGDTVSEQILTAWKAGELRHLGWVPEPGEMSSREFLERMWKAVDGMNHDDIKHMRIESGDFTKMPVGDEYDAVPLLEKMFYPENPTGGSESTIRPMPRPSDLGASEFAPETSPRPVPRPSLSPESSPRPVPKPESILPREPQIEVEPEPKSRNKPFIPPYNPNNPERTA
jgi:hypothetical protein